MANNGRDEGMGFEIIQGCTSHNRVLEGGSSTMVACDWCWLQLVSLGICGVDGGYSLGNPVVCHTIVC